MIINSILYYGFSANKTQRTHRVRYISETSVLYAITFIISYMQLINALEPNTELVIDPSDTDTFRAIRSLHTKLDVDADGEVDDLESKKFLESDKIEVSDDNKGAYSTAHKLRYLHQDGKDRSISVDDLWVAWKNSQVYNWTIDDTVNWLANYVELPEYSQLFQANQINGTLLPRLAADSQFINKLGINDPSARKKISIKAIDVVLFGPPKYVNSSKLRDTLVSIITVIAISFCFIFYKKSIASQKALHEMQENLESLQKAEDQMQELQRELDKAREAAATEKKNLEHQLEMHRQHSSASLIEPSRLTNGEYSKYSASETNINGNNQDAYILKLEDDLKNLRKELEETYNSMHANKFRAPFPLRALLKATYDTESQYYNEKKLHLESKATELKLRNQKLQKKKSSLFGYYKMAQENSIEEDINTIVETKEAIMQVTKEIKERTDRWKAIEELCGCSLDLTPILRV